MNASGWLFLLSAVVVVTTATLNETITMDALSGCNECADTGNCEFAFRNRPGHFCGHWLANSISLPCCCPLNAACRVTPFSCKCRVYPNRYPTRRYDYPRRHETSDFWDFIGSTIMGVLFLCCCFSLLKNCCSPDNHYYPVGGQPTYQPGYQQTAAYPVAEPMYYGTTTGSNNLGAAALGATAGVVAGGLLGSALSSHNNYGNGGGGGDCAYDIAGDFGGNDDDGGYDIQGDF